MNDWSSRKTGKCSSCGVFLVWSGYYQSKGFNEGTVVHHWQGTMGRRQSSWGSVQLSNVLLPWVHCCSTPLKWKHTHEYPLLEMAFPDDCGLLHQDNAPAINQKCSKRVWRISFRCLLGLQISEISIQLTICGMFRTNKSISHHIILTSYCQMTPHTFRELVETCLDGSGVSWHQKADHASQTPSKHDQPDLWWQRPWWKAFVITCLRSSCVFCWTVG